MQKLPIFFLLGLLIHQLGFQQAKHKYEKTYCEVPDISCDKYEEVIQEWIKSYEQQEEQLIDCRKDLIRTQNEFSSDITCSEGTCFYE